MEFRILLLFGLSYLGCSIGCPNVVGPDSSKFFVTKHCAENCTFKYRNISKSTIGAFPTPCETVCADLFIGEHAELTEEQLTLAFKNMKHLIGGFVMYCTNYTSARFLAALESIETDYTQMVWEDNYYMEELGMTNLTSITCSGITVSSGSAMKHLNLPNLKFAKSNNLDYPEVHVMISNMNNNFCITFDEMEKLMNIDNLDLSSLDAMYCPPTVEDKICTTPVKGCTRIYGDVEIGPDFDLKIMKNVESIFGTLVINGTELSNLSFLESLKYVAPLGWKPASLGGQPGGERKYAIVVENNPNLVNYTFPKLKRVRGDQPYIIVFDNNNEELSYNPEMCFQLKEQLNTTQNPAVDGLICGFIKSKAENRDGSRKEWIILALIICVSLVLFLALIAYCCCCKQRDNDTSDKPFS